MRFGILTSARGCPGLNAAIRAFVRRALLNGDKDKRDNISGWYHFGYIKV
jgi:hypothetical protein